jgi:hypothetical protein
VKEAMEKQEKREKERIGEDEDGKKEEAEMKGSKTMKRRKKSSQF